MTDPLPAQPGFGVGTDVAGFEIALTDWRAGWHQHFSQDLPEGMDLREPVIRTRAWLAMIVEYAHSGQLAVPDLTPIDAVAMFAEVVRAQLSGPTMLGYTPAELHRKKVR